MWIKSSRLRATEILQGPLGFPGDETLTEMLRSRWAIAAGFSKAANFSAHTRKLLKTQYMHLLRASSTVEDEMKRKEEHYRRLPEDLGLGSGKSRRRQLGRKMKRERSRTMKIEVERKYNIAKM